MGRVPWSDTSHLLRLNRHLNRMTPKFSVQFLFDVPCSVTCPTPEVARLANVIIWHLSSSYAEKVHQGPRLPKRSSVEKCGRERVQGPRTIPMAPSPRACQPRHPQQDQHHKGRCAFGHAAGHPRLLSVDLLTIC